MSACGISNYRVICFENLILQKHLDRTPYRLGFGGLLKFNLGDPTLSTADHHTYRGVERTQQFNFCKRIVLIISCKNHKIA